MKRIIHVMLALVTIVGSVNAQTLSVQPIEMQTGEQTEVVVSLMGGTSATALQFNLKLPEGVTVNANNTTLGVATDGHTLCVEPLDNGDYLFILYSMDLMNFKDGEILRIPVTAGNSATNATGQLYTICTATSYAVSHICDNATFSITVNAPNTKVGDIDGNGTVNVSDAIDLIGHYINGTTDELDKSVADVDGNGVINVSDAIEIIDIYINNR